MDSDYVELINSRDPILRNRAALALGKRGLSDERAITVLVKALKDTAWRVRGNAAKALAKLDPGSPAIFDQVSNLLRDNEESVRTEAFSAILHMIENGLSVDRNRVDKIALYYHDHRLDVRLNAIRILHQLGVSTPDSIDTIVAAVKDPSEKVRYWAIEAASSFHEAAIRALPALIESLSNDSEEVKYVAVSTLGEMGEDASFAIPAIRGLLRTDDPHLRFLAAYALIKVDKGPMNVLVANVLKETLESSNADERRLAAHALAEKA